ncbi:hypothetical protein [uncultured Chryseobacterium sp.]|uniref:hypothetical protein n=1 Tax=uncultured Chryseobacterium sp. TaxID=259322 RepID=UPI003749D432
MSVEIFRAVGEFEGFQGWRVGEFESFQGWRIGEFSDIRRSWRVEGRRVGEYEDRE